MVGKVFQWGIPFLCLCFFVLTTGCGGLSSLSNDSETETNPVSAIETESFQSLEELLGNPSVSSLTDAEQASVDAFLAPKLN